jgi:hypothetical protein
MVGVMSMVPTGRSTTPAGMPGWRIARGTLARVSCTLKKWSRMPCSPKLLPWSAVTITTSSSPSASSSRPSISSL